jgi:CubicO group peptidase (beta-lactamase class C family)
MAALDAISRFGADHAAGAVIDRSGVVSSVGDESFRYPLASVTKLFSSYATLIAIEERTVGLDDPAGPPNSTLRHLLAHASGLSPDHRDRCLAPPGTRRIYSNAGFEVLADHVAERAEVPFREYLYEAVFGPLSMAGADLDGSPASGATASLADCTLFASELLSPTLIARSTLGQATKVAFSGIDGVLPGFGRQHPCDWGLGFEIRDGKSPHWTGQNNSPATFGHFGQLGSFVWADPAVPVALVVLSDRAFGPWAGAAWPVLSDAVLAER